MSNLHPLSALLLLLLLIPSQIHGHIKPPPVSYLTPPVTNPPPVSYLPPPVTNPPPVSYLPPPVTNPPPVSYQPPPVTNPPPISYQPPPVTNPPPSTTPPLVSYLPPPVHTPPPSTTPPPPARTPPPSTTPPPARTPPPSTTPPPARTPPPTTTPPSPVSYLPPPVNTPPRTTPPSPVSYLPPPSTTTPPPPSTTPPSPISYLPTPSSTTPSPGRRYPSLGIIPPKNATRIQFSERQFMLWIKLIGGLRHSVFKTAKNKLFASYTLNVAKNPSAGDFTSIQDAIDSLPLINLVRVIIKVHEGVYTEKVNIPPFKSFITIEGAGAEKTIIQWGDTAQTPGSNGRPMGTFNSATFAVNSPYFIAKNITFKNTTPLPAPGAVGRQAAAFRISGDTAAFYGCKFLGAQDTLYDHVGRHYYKDCYIEGSVDFIFGNALSLYEGCHVHAIAQFTGALTAQGRSSLLEATGFSFVNCRVTGSGALFLGRAWGAFSRVIFAYTYMDNIIIPKGWYNWGDRNRELTVFYGQYKCTGAGANFAGRVSWSRELTEAQAKPFISLSFIDGSEWIKT